jgi:hypothetical protein
MYNSAFFLTVLAFLSMSAESLSAQLIAHIQNKKINLDPQVLELKKEIEGGGIVNLLSASDNRVDGINSFDKNILQTGRVVVFDEVSIGYKSDAAKEKEGVLAYTSALPAALQNSLFVIAQNGKEILRMPTIDLTNLAAGQNASDQYTKLKSLRLLADDKTITMQLIFAPGAVLDPATKHYIYIRLNGLQTTVKA